MSLSSPTTPIRISHVSVRNLTDAEINRFQPPEPPRNFIETVLPINIGKVSLREKAKPKEGDDTAKSQGDKKTSEPEDKLLFESGFDAGYKAGLWKAELEAKKLRSEWIEDATDSVEQLKFIHANLIEAAQKNFPELLLASLARLFKNHRFSEEEVAGEVNAILKEVSHAQSVTIECTPQELDRIQQTFEKVGLPLQRGQQSWKSNPNLQRGEFILHTDLGTVDGRRLTKTERVTKALMG